MRSLLRDLARRIGEVADATDTSFSHLVGLARLDPKVDFKGADLSHVDFGAADLSGYDFTDANLSYSNLSRARNIGGACLTRTNLESARLPTMEALSRRSDDFFLAKTATVAARRLVNDSLWHLFRSRKLRIRAQDGKRLDQQMTLFSSHDDEKEHTISIESVCFALPITISMTSFRKWQPFHMRGQWRTMMLRSGRPDLSKYVWIKAWCRPSRVNGDAFDIVVAPLNIKSVPQIRLQKLVSGMSVSAASARFVANSYSEVFEEEAATTHVRIPVTILHGQPDEVRNRAERIFSKPRQD